MSQVFPPSLFFSAAVTMASKKDDELYTDNKVSVLQDARVFNESPINPRKCRALLTRVVFLLYGGEQLQTHEATNLFFATTKLFQHKDVRE
jgi:coatomer protein complex subunit gamma